LPKRSIMIQPVVHGAQRSGIELIDAMAAVAALFDKARAAQQAQMFGDGGAGNRKRLGDTASREIAPAEEIEDGAACGIGQRVENSLGRICNRTVTHNA